MLAGQSPSRLDAQVRSDTIVATSDTAILALDSSIDRLVRSRDLVVRRADVDALVVGRMHEHMEQFYDGVRIYGGGLTRQTNNGLTVSIFGTMYRDISLDVVPRLSVDDAVAVVKSVSGVDLGPSKLPELVVLPEDDGTYRLVYRASAFTAAGGIEYFIDASSGAVVRELDAAQRQSPAVASGSGVLGDLKKVSVESLSSVYVASDLLRPPTLNTYDMGGNQTKVLNFLNGLTSLVASDLAASTSTTWTDPVTLDAQAYQGLVYDYYFKRFGRRGLDGNNLRILGLAHPARRQDLFLPSSVPSFFCNAFYAGSGVMVYGEGFPPGVVFAATRQSCNFLAGGLDVIAHELTHGVTAYTSQLIYANESGALNEAFSDIMGVSVRFYYRPVATGGLRTGYEIGDDVVTPGGIRSMDNPALFGQPDHFSKRVILPNTPAGDNGGVHTNSGIANHAFYLAIEGGVNRTSGLAVQGVGGANREQMERVFYRGFTQLMPANATHSVARAVTIQAARDLYGVGSAPERAVTQAWTAVGVN
jgi:thermolysin